MGGRAKASLHWLIFPLICHSPSITVGVEPQDTQKETYARLSNKNLFGQKTPGTQGRTSRVKAVSCS